MALKNLNNPIITGKVGIGGAPDGADLHLISGTTVSTMRFQTDLASGGYIQYTDSDVLRFYTNTNIRTSITSDGNVGIGIFPSDVNQSYISGAYTECIIQGNSANKIGSLQIRSAGTTNVTHLEIAAADTLAESYIWNATNSDMVFGTNNAERMRLTSEGNLLTSGDMTISGDQLTLGGVQRISQAFPVTANTNRRVRITLTNYTSVKLFIAAQRTNGGDSLAYWEGVLNNNNDTAYSTAFNARTSSGTMAYTLTNTSGASSTFDFDFNNSGSGGTGMFIIESIVGTPTYEITTY